MATSYANNGGTGERRVEIVTTTNFVSSAGDIGTGASYSADQLGVFVDGVTSTTLGNGGTGRQFGNGNDNNDRNVQFDFGVGAAIVIDEIKIYLSGTASHGSNFTIEGSNNGSSWTTLKSAFNITGNSLAGTAYSFTNTTAYRYYRLHTTGTSTFGGSSGNWTEFEFKLEDTTPQTSRTSVYNTGGKGNRTAFVTVTTDLSLSAGSISLIIDGDQTNNSSHAITLNAGGTTKNIMWDFGAGISPVIDTIGIWTGAAPTNSDGSWKFQGSPDASSWTDLESTSTLFDTGNGYKLTKRTVANTTGYRYYRLLQTSGSTAILPTITEVEFKISGYTTINAKDFKLSGYGVIAPITAKDFKLSAYGVVAPVTARAYKASGYAIVKPVAASGNQPVLIVIVG